MKIEISDMALANDKKGTILSFLNFIEKVYTECPVLVDDGRRDHWVVYQDTNKILSVMEFSNEKYSKEEAIEIFNLIVYGKPPLDTPEADV